MNINSTIVLAFAYSILGSEFSNSHITTPDTLEMFFYRTDAVPKCSKLKCNRLANESMTCPPFLGLCGCQRFFTQP